MRTSRLVVSAGKTVAVVAILMWSLFPIAFIVISSFKPGQDIFAVPPKYLFAPTVKHYVELWNLLGRVFPRPAEQFTDHGWRHCGCDHRQYLRRVRLFAPRQPFPECKYRKSYCRSPDPADRGYPPAVPDRQHARPQRHPFRADRALRNVLRVAWHGSHAHVHRPDPARARRSGGNRRREVAPQFCGG